jgi:hypothetical protein
MIASLPIMRSIITPVVGAWNATANPWQLTTITVTIGSFGSTFAEVTALALSAIVVHISVPMRAITAREASRRSVGAGDERITSAESTLVDVIALSAVTVGISVPRGAIAAREASRRSVGAGDERITRAESTLVNGNTIGTIRDVSEVAALGRAIGARYIPSTRPVQ